MATAVDQASLDRDGSRRRRTKRLQRQLPGGQTPHVPAWRQRDVPSTAGWCNRPSSLSDLAARSDQRERAIEGTPTAGPSLSDLAACSDQWDWAKEMTPAAGSSMAPTPS